jgi:hypothetical protein
MIARIALAALLLGGTVTTALAAPAPVRCHGTLSGSVRGKFGCLVETRRGDEGQILFVITAKDPLPGVPQYAPGAFELPEPLAAGTYTLDTLGMGLASVAAEGGTLYTASKTLQQRGEVALKLTSVTKTPRGHEPGVQPGPGAGPYSVRGTYRARLVPAGAGKSGEVIVEVSF